MTHNVCNGDHPNIEFIKNCETICKDSNVKMHLDGARVFNALVSLKV